MGMRNNLIFGGVNSASYGIFITGAGVYNAPVRAVEKVTVPGRNGLLMLDQGRYENITVEYPAFAFGKTRKEFREKIAAFRNAIASLTGYQRLEDTYHPEEYRMGLYADGLNVDVGAYGGSGRFALKFNCKPQRYLKDGEQIIERNSGGAVINPTKHASEPLLIANGYGDIRIGDSTINISDGVIGRINVSDPLTVSNRSVERSWNINESQYNPGDHVNVGAITLNTIFTITNDATYLNQAYDTDRVMGIEYWNTRDSDAALGYSMSGKTVYFGIQIPAVELTIGQNLSRKYSIRATVNVQNPTNWQSNRLYCTYEIKYTNGILKITANRLLFNTEGDLNIANPQESCTIAIRSITGDSSLSILEDTIYMDCETGEAYAIKDGEYTLLNSIVSFGSDLPKLEPGRNEIILGETIEGLKLIPRWWQI